MNEKIEQLYIDAINEDLPPNVFANEVLDLFSVSDQSELLDFGRYIIGFSNQYDGKTVKDYYFDFKRQ